jgi:hypothetical protein
MTCGCKQGMGFLMVDGQMPGRYQGRRHFMGSETTPEEDLVAAVASADPADNADTMIETGQIMYKEGFSSGRVKGILIGALMGAGLLLLVGR